MTLKYWQPINIEKIALCWPKNLYHCVTYERPAAQVLETKLVDHRDEYMKSFPSATAPFSSFIRQE